MKRKTKQTLKMVALGVVGLGAVVGAASVLGNLRSEDDGLKTIHPTFEVGGLNDADGKYEETKLSIYTKDAFECKGLDIDLDFDNNIKYQVFYYEADGDFISASQVLEGNQDLSLPALATHARLEITPIWKDNVKEKDQEIKWYQVAKYATQLDIKVDEDQTYYAEERIINFTIDDFTQANYTETWLLEDVTTTLDTRYIISDYVKVDGSDVVIHSDDENYTFKYAVFKGTPSEDTRLNGTGFEKGNKNLSQYINDEATYYIAICFEKSDKSAFTQQDLKNLVNSFYITYNA